MAATRSRARRRTGSRRKLVWARTAQFLTFAADTGAISAPQSADLLANLEAELGASLIGCTVMRVRGVMAGTGSAGQPIVVAAIRVGEKDDTIAPLRPVDNPLAQAGFPGAAGAHLDWMSYEPFLPLAGPGTPAQGRVVDIKSMRKIDEVGESLGIYIGAISAAASTINFGFQLSVLVALP